MNALSRYVGIISSLLAFASTSSTAYAEPLRISLPTWVGSAPIYIAQEKGFFADEGVDVHIIKFEEGNLEALFDDQVDAVMLDFMGVAAQQPANDREMVLLLAVSESAGADGVAAIHEVRSIGDLAGKTVAYDANTVSEFLLKILLGEAGLAMSDIEGIDIDGQDGAEAFMLQEFDAVVTWEPWLTSAKNAEHGHLLTDSSDWPGLIIDGLFTFADLLETRRVEFKAVARAWDRAVDYVETDPDEAIEIMARNVGGWLEDPAEFAATMKGVRFYDKPRNEEYFGTAKKPGEVHNMAQRTIEILSELGRVQKTDLVPTDLIAHGIWD